MAPRSARPHALIAATLTTLLALALLLPAGASAAFTRPFLRQITRAENPSGVACSSTESSCIAPDGIALGEEDKLWVGDGTAHNRLDEFGSAYQGSEPNDFLPPTLPIEAPTFPESMAIERLTGDFYITGANAADQQDQNVEVYDGAGKLVEVWKRTFESPSHLTIDDSSNALGSDPSACGSTCTVYVSAGGGQEHAIEKFNGRGEPIPFSDSGTASYIKGNEITGTPVPEGGCEHAEFENEVRPEALTVDSSGDIYVTVPRCKDIFEYRASGEFMRVFDEVEAPSLPGQGAVKGFYHPGIAIDPVSGHLLIASSVELPETESNGVLLHGESRGAIDEFDLDTGKFVDQITEISTGVPLREPVEIAVDSRGDVYVADHGETVKLGGVNVQVDAGVEVYANGHYLPSLKLGGAGERTSTSAVLNGEADPESFANPERTGLGECFFEYIGEAEFDADGFHGAAVAPCVPAATAIPADSSYHAVHADVKGLAPGITYRYRLLASTPGALGGAANSESLAFTAPGKPVIVSTAAANLSSTSAEVHAQIEPLGAATSYHFEYDTRAYGQGEASHGISVPTPDASLGSGGPAGNSLESVSQHVGALTPGTVYYFRVIAQNALGAAEETAQSRGTFTTLPETSPGLPDHRAYELVTPTDHAGGSDMFAEATEGGEAENRHNRGTPSQSGNGFLLETPDAFGPFPFAAQSAYVFRRDPEKGEWTYTSLASPSLGVQTVEPYAGVIFDPADLSRVGFTDLVGAAAGTEGTRLTSLVGPPGGPYGTPLREDPPHFGAGVDAEATHVVSGSQDLTHVVLESASNSVCPGPEKVAEKNKHGNVLCEWSGGYEPGEDGEIQPQLKLVNIDSEGELPSTCGATLGGGGVFGGSSYHAMSADGSRIFFSAPDPDPAAQNDGPGCWNGEKNEPAEGPKNAPQLYVRIDGTKTVEVSTPEPGVSEAGKPPVQYPAAYVGAAEDGSRVFFATATWLTKNHPAGHDPELYECKIIEVAGTPGCELTRVSAGETGTASADVVMTLAISADGSVVYFTANGVLAPGASPGNCEHGSGFVGSCPLYRYEAATAGAPAKTTFVATTAKHAFVNSDGSGGSIAPEPEFTQAYTTPNGGYLLFKNADGIYRYDAASNSLTLIASGEDTRQGPNGSYGPEFTRSAPDLPVSGPLRAMSDDGSYVFFDTPAALVPQDTNGVLDVYEWHEGRISLISSGTSPQPSYFLGYSPYEYETSRGTIAKVEGGNVFFGTHARLVPQDTNSVGDIYDARVCEPEAPCLKAPAGETAQCEGGACQSPPPAPSDPTPGSLTFAGAGNLLASPPPPPKQPAKKSVKCAKGKQAQHGKCVKPKRKRNTKKAKAKKASDDRRASS